MSTKESKTTLSALKVQARKLYVEDGLTAKEVSKIVNVSENSMGAWVRKYKWRDQHNIIKANQLGLKAIDGKLLEIFANDLKLHISVYDPKIYKKAALLIDHYLKLKNA